MMTEDEIAADIKADSKLKAEKFLYEELYDSIIRGKNIREYTIKYQEYMDSPLLMQDEKQQLLLHLAVEQDNENNIKVLMREAELTPGLLKTMLLTQDSTGETALMSAFLGQRPAAIRAILAKVLSSEGLMVEVLTKADAKGRSPIKHIIRGANTIAFKEIAKAANKHGVAEDMAKFKDNNGYGILEIVKDVRNTAFNNMVINWLKDPATIDAVDTVSYVSSPSGVTVNLSTGGEGTTNVKNIIGSEHNDILVGDQENNDIQGGEGADILQDGGGGEDRFTGGPGFDRFVISPSKGIITITDFKPMQDKIDLEAFNADFIQVIKSAQDKDKNCEITLASKKIILEGFNKASLQASWFILNASTSITIQENIKTEVEARIAALEQLNNELQASFTALKEEKIEDEKKAKKIEQLNNEIIAAAKRAEEKAEFYASYERQAKKEILDKLLETLEKSKEKAESDANYERQVNKDFWNKYIEALVASYETRPKEDTEAIKQLLTEANRSPDKQEFEDWHSQARYFAKITIAVVGLLGGLYFLYNKLCGKANNQLEGFSNLELPKFSKEGMVAMKVSEEWHSNQGQGILDIDVCNDQHPIRDVLNLNNNWRAFAGDGFQIDGSDHMV